MDTTVLRETFVLGRRLKRNPYGMLAGALGIGFALGGGIFSRLTSRILGAGIRVGLMAALPILQRQLIDSLTHSKLDTKKETDQ